MTLRTRLIIGFIGVSVLSAVITAVTAVAGALVIFATRPIGASVWGHRLAERTPLAVLSDSDLVWLLAVAVTGLLAIAVSGGWLVSRRMLRPVRRLAAAAERVAHGDLDVRLSVQGSDELAQLAGTFDAMTASLAGSMGELRRLEGQARRFASDVSHELRTPLAAMIAVTDVLEDESEHMPPGAARAARLVVQEITHLDRLVLDLIEMSRFDAGTALLDTDVVDVAEQVRGCLARRAWTPLVLVEAPPGVLAALDRRRFDVIVANLVGNAVKYGRPPIELAVTVVPGRRQLQLTVADAGPGLSAEALAHVFERFDKADGARTRSDGSGLGLAIALENARLHGGTLTAANRPDPAGGAVFTLHLPWSGPGATG